ncbi:MAG: hypothetical protein OEV49_14990 [candidate division Zixibacteria bacterium]|nr:hypothetical protein [candidate division Zixibacteria bacterium]MDH3936483.1 hypothetical protein [candidate division Zixibacteria bacterium]MDH4033695.1 hypothetical protein [candidate division Zixibacteria bacterium]
MTAVLCVIAATLASCSLRDPKSLSETEIFSFDVTPTSIPADGVSDAVVHICLGDETPEGSTATLTTEFGLYRISGGESDDNQQGRQVSISVAGSCDDVSLVSTTRFGVNTIAVKMDGFVQTKEITFTRALPERIQLIPDRFTATANGVDRILLTAELEFFSGIGTPSEGNRITYLTRNLADGSEVSALRREVQSDSFGIAWAEIFIGTAGTYEVVVFAEDDVSVRDSVVVTFQ